ncbi:FeoB-associated Cys-rich membrane protein [Flavobacterium sp.]
MTQEIIAILLLIIAVIFLYLKFFGKKKNDKNCGGDCGCN